MKNEIIIFKDEDIRLEVSMHDETVWLTQAQIAELFATQRPAITKHIGNIFRSEELFKEEVCSKMEHTASDGKKYNMEFYNLDVIIAVGYRVNSKRATNFRRWASSILKEYFLQGRVINESRLDYIEKTTKVKVRFK